MQTRLTAVPGGHVIPVSARSAMRGLSWRFNILGRHGTTLKKAPGNLPRRIVCCWGRRDYHANKEAVGWGREARSQEQRGNGSGPNPECWVNLKEKRKTQTQKEYGTHNRQESIASLPWLVDHDNGMEMGRKVVRWPWISRAGAVKNRMSLGPPVLSGR